MKQIVLTCLGLIGLSAAGGAALFASHTALAAGPRLPNHLVRAHAIAASRATQAIPIALTDDKNFYDDRNTAHNPGLSVSAAETDNENRRAVPRISSQDRVQLGLAPERALRPMARDTAGDNVAAAVVPPVRRTVPTTARRAAPVQSEPVVRQAAPVQRVIRSEPVVTRRSAPSSSNRINPNYMHGVFR